MTDAAEIYAQALYSLAAQEQAEEQILRELCALTEAFGQEPAYLRLLSAYDLPKAQRCGIIEEGFRGKIHGYLLNFMRLLTEKGHIGLFSDICRRYEAIYNAEHNILPVDVFCAVTPGRDQLKRLEEKLGEITGKTVRLHIRLDAACIGGLRLSYDGKSVDGTVRRRLDAMRDLLTG